MARLKRTPVESGPDESESDEHLPLHEGPMPDRGDVEAYRRWRAIRSARWQREMGGPNDPRWVLLSEPSPTFKPSKRTH
jgi:hypothetical protein